MHFLLTSYIVVYERSDIWMLPNHLLRIQFPLFSEGWEWVHFQEWTGHCSLTIFPFLIVPLFIIGNAFKYFLLVEKTYILLIIEGCHFKDVWFRCIQKYSYAICQFPTWGPTPSIPKSDRALYFWNAYDMSGTNLITSHTLAHLLLTRTRVELWFPLHGGGKWDMWVVSNLPQTTQLIGVRTWT